MTDPTELTVPSSLTLALTRVLIEPLFRDQGEGEPDALLHRIAGLCSRRLSGGRLAIDDVCGRFAGWRIRRGLRNDEVRAIKGSGGISLISPPYLIIESYAPGLTSYRVSLTLKPLSTEDLLESWRGISRVIRSILDSRMPNVQRYLTSKFFSEIYAFYDYNISPIVVKRLWKDLEPSMGRDSRYFLSPLKTMSEPNPPKFSWIPDPSYISPDGLLVVFLSSGRRFHATRRKKRRIHRIAVDHALGLKVFLENQDLWIRDPESCWGALVGMIYLNPEVLRGLWRFTGRRFLNVYESLIAQLNLEEMFENYRDNFWFPFRDDTQMSIFLDTVRLLGSSIQQLNRPSYLDNLHLDALKLIVVKSQLDSLLMPWDDLKLRLLANYLCKFLRSDSPSSDCVERFLSSIGSRRKRRGLTYLELSSILSPIYGERARNALEKSSSLLAKLEDLGHIERGIDRRERARRKGERTKKGFEVSFFIPSRSYLVDILSRRLEEQVIQAAEEIMKIVGKYESLFSK